MKKKKLIIIGSVIAGCLAATVLACVIYVNDYNHALSEVSNYLVSSDNVTVSQDNNKTYLFKGKEEKATFIFYPGGKVEYTAYAPLMYKLAENNITCVLPHMMANLAFLSMKKAKDYVNQYDNVYLGGHSLGGVAATSYLKSNTDKYKGLILEASYSTADLSQTSLRTLSITASNDKVLNQESYEKNKSNLPSLTEKVIQGGIHSYFGDYGIQKGDGTPDITYQEQLEVNVSYIVDFILETN